MKRITVPILFASALFVACGGRSASSSENTVNPRDTVTVPEGCTGVDSIAYIENIVLQSPISAEELLGLVEIHAVEDRFYYYNNEEEAKESPEYADYYMVTHQDSAAMRLANRFMRMAYLVNMNGKANDKLQWAVAVNAIIDTFRVAVPSVHKDSVIAEIARVADKFSSLTQSEMNFQSYLDATVDYYQTIEAYRQWLLAVPKDIRPLAQEEYEAWHDLHDARFALWNDVSYRQE